MKMGRKGWIPRRGKWKSIVLLPNSSEKSGFSLKELVSPTCAAEMLTLTLTDTLLYSAYLTWKFQQLHINQYTSEIRISS